MNQGDAERVFRIGGGSDAPAHGAPIGTKASNLVRLSRLGLSVPPAVALTTMLSLRYAERGSGGFAAKLTTSLHWLERVTGLTFGGHPPLLLSVRSSPSVTMPGMLETLLNVGLTESGVANLVRRTGNPWMAWDAYRRLVRSFGHAVGHVAPGVFDRLAASHLDAAGVRSIQELDAVALRELARESASLLRATTGQPLPQDPLAQVVAAVDAVLASWNSERARTYRRVNGLDENAGTGVLLQAMVFGNAGPRSGSGVAFTRNPATGDNEIYFDFVFNAQGEDIVSGREPVGDGAMLPRILPEAWSGLQSAKHALEREFGDMQDVEFTVEEGRLSFLQTRDGKRTPWAAARIAADLVRDGIIDPVAALRRLSDYDLRSIVRFSAMPGPDTQPIARATPASLGVATGSISLDARPTAESRPFILVRPDMSVNDLTGIVPAAGIVTTFGGRTSHAAVIARQLGKPCLVCCTSLRVDDGARECSFGARRFREGDIITVDGNTGLIYSGEIPVVADRPREALAAIDSWRGAVVSPPATVEP